MRKIMRKRWFIDYRFAYGEIRDAAMSDEPGCSISSEGSVSAESLVYLLNQIIPAPAGDLHCGGSGEVIRSGVKGPAACPFCGQVFQPWDAQEGPWHAWPLPKHNQPDDSPTEHVPPQVGEP